MTRIIDDPETFAATALDGFCAVNAHIARRVRGGAVRATRRKQGKVAVLVGGGSGHYPAFAGYIGPGLADGCVAGDIFASPSASAAQNVARHAERGGGVIIGFGNYAGDVLHFGLAAQRLRAEGIDTRVLLVTDDVASAKKGEEGKRRGIAGDMPVFKIAGAAAEEGHDIDAVMRFAEHANDRTRSFGVAFSGCTLPGADQPLFTVPEKSMGVGLGIHGEPGIDEKPMATATELAALLVDRLLDEAPASAGRRVAAVLNGLGSTGMEELFLLWTAIEPRLKKAGLELVQPEVGIFVSSLDMAGCSLSLTWLDDDLERLWRAPCDTPALRRGPALATEPDDDVREDKEAELPTSYDATGDQRRAGQCVARAVERLAATMKSNEEELGRIDAVAGDGDHGMGMARGSAAAAAGAHKAADAGAPAADVLSAAANAWADRAGGSSGAIWGVGLLAWAAALEDEKGPSLSVEAMAKGARAAYDGVTSLGGAKPGDKTLVDVLGPFVEAFEGAVKGGATLAAAWDEALVAADKAAEATKNLLPRVGRARPLAERSKGHPDAGAVSLAMCLRSVGEQIKEN